MTSVMLNEEASRGTEGGETGRVAEDVVEEIGGGVGNL